MNNQNPELAGSLNGEKAAQTAPVTQKQPENFIAGIVGAFLFSLIGGLLYFIIYQVGFIAGITGLAIFVLANFGYGLFSGKKNSVKGVIVSTVILILVTLLAEYLCVAYEIYDAFKEYGISFFDAIRVTPSFITDPELDLLGSVISDVLFALVFGALSAFGSIRAAIQAGKASAAADAPVAPAAPADALDPAASVTDAQSDEPTVSIGADSDAQSENQE